MVARTHYAEGRLVTNFLRGLFVILGWVIYFYVIPGLHWSFLFVFLISGVIVAEIIGSIWIQSKRKSTKRTRASRDSSSKQKVRNTRLSRTTILKSGLSDEEIINTDIDTLSGTDFERLIKLYLEIKGMTSNGLAGLAVMRWT